MKMTALAVPALAICLLPARAAETPQAGKIYDQQLTMLERELVPLAEAMPAAKYDFAPSNGAFTGVRTFAQQVKHIAYVMYDVSAAVLEEKNPSTTGAHENGPDDLKTKDQIVNYLKQAFAYGHKAMTSLTNANQLDLVKSAFGGNQVPRVSMASVAVWHSFDHYGQMIVYSRMNGVIPPASRR
jgi:uncharacterized damage-inducible protein DinB